MQSIAGVFSQTQKLLLLIHRDCVSYILAGIDKMDLFLIKEDYVSMHFILSKCSLLWGK